MHLDGLRAAADCGAWYAALRRDALNRRLAGDLGEYTTVVDGPRIVFSANADPTRRIEAHAWLVASIDASVTGLRWGWAEPSSAGSPADLRGVELRRAGERLGLRELLEPTIPLTAGTDVTRTLETIGAVAVQIVGTGPYHCVDLDDGRHGVFLLSGPDVSGPGADTGRPEAGEPTLSEVAACLPGLLAGIPVGDHRVAVHGLAVRTGWHIVWRADGAVAAGASSCVITDGVSTVALAFDGKGRPVSAPRPA
ncbi:hypothetical protein GYA93_06460 [Gordonia desulfuricans]|uniref:Uncharacterized protein n=1 Tax=Gordonia desulfuricans TaxID=89051 RepID=A0A7K3LLV1_9ACTN|nr:MULTISPECIES: DUF6882 domain-containing protein [Gordonia]EMP11831.1 hypothetical protein ISGA_3713 [Gordonia sp. NB41Y]NDK89226.1 hypothetical protein [Gordonia desulfuricans]WLP89370.1 hypothetical protein Q9K23_17525 [Gordonia sp. NB41Y]